MFWVASLTILVKDVRKQVGYQGGRSNMAKIKPPFRVDGVPVPAKGYLRGSNTGQAYNKGYKDGELEGSYKENLKHQGQMKMVDEALKLMDEGMQSTSLAQRILLAIRGVCPKCGNTAEIPVELGNCTRCEGI